MRQRLQLGLSFAKKSAAGPTFDPATLFSGGEDGYLLDISDISSLWKDTAGTDPVTANDDAVARVDSLAGTGTFFQQGTAARRPLYKAGANPYLYFDDVDDDINMSFLSSSKPVTICAAMTFRSGASFNNVFLNNGNQTPQINQENGSGARFATRWVKTNTSRCDVDSFSFDVPFRLILDFIEGDGVIPICYIDGTEVNMTGVVGDGVSVTDTNYIGALSGGSLNSQINLYALVRIGRELTAQELTDVDAWLAGKLP